jgi:hypothetical protein
MAQQQQQQTLQDPPAQEGAAVEQQGPALDAAAAAEAVAAFSGTSAGPTLEAVLAETERNELAKMEVELRQFEHNQRLAKMFLASNCFNDAKGPTAAESIAKAMVKIELGRSMGFSPIEAMQGIDIIKGRPAIGAHLRASRMQAAGYFWVFLQNDEVACHIEVYFGNPAKGGTKLGKVGFTFEEAKRAKLTGKDNWSNYASDMLFARAITRAQRRFAPAALKGVNILDSEEALHILPDTIDPSAGMKMPERETTTS